MLSDAATLDSEDLCPETDRSPVTAVKSAPRFPQRYVIDGITVWATSWVKASEIAAE